MRKKTEKSKIANIIFAIIFTILIIYALFVIIMLLWGIMTSLKSIEDINGLYKKEYPWISRSQRESCVGGSRNGGRVYLP